jgi:hypothetical protein
MTGARASQAGAEVLYRVEPSQRVSQAGAEYLHRILPPMSVSQAGAEYLHRVQPTFAISQAGTEYLHKAQPCTTQWAQVWTITRTDGVTFRFTSLDRDLEWPPGSGTSFQACDSLITRSILGCSTVLWSRRGWCRGKVQERSVGCSKEALARSSKSSRHSRSSSWAMGRVFSRRLWLERFSQAAAGCSAMRAVEKIWGRSPSLGRWTAQQAFGRSLMRLEAKLRGIFLVVG